MIISEVIDHIAMDFESWDGQATGMYQVGMCNGKSNYKSWFISPPYNWFGGRNLKVETKGIPYDTKDSVTMQKMVDSLTSVSTKKNKFILIYGLCLDLPCLLRICELTNHFDYAIVVDVQCIASNLLKAPNMLGLKQCCSLLGMDSTGIHDAGIDALLTYNIFERLKSVRGDYYIGHKEVVPNSKLRRLAHRLTRPTNQNYSTAYDNKFIKWVPNKQVEQVILSDDEHNYTRLKEFKGNIERRIEQLVDESIAINCTDMLGVSEALVTKGISPFKATMHDVKRLGYIGVTKQEFEFIKGAHSIPIRLIEQSNLTANELAKRYSFYIE